MSDALKGSTGEIYGVEENLPSRMKIGRGRLNSNRRLGECRGRVKKWSRNGGGVRVVRGGSSNAILAECGENLSKNLESGRGERCLEPKGKGGDLNTTTYYYTYVKTMEKIQITARGINLQRENLEKWPWEGIKQKISPNPEQKKLRGRMGESPRKKADMRNVQRWGARSRGGERIPCFPRWKSKERKALAIDKQKR